MKQTKTNKKTPAKKKNLTREKRKHPRLAPKGLWISEFKGDYRFTSEVKDIALGGVFLKKRVERPGTKTFFVLRSDSHIQVELTAVAVRDKLKNGLGTAYEFTKMTASKTRLLRALLRDLN